MEQTQRSQRIRRIRASTAFITIAHIVAIAQIVTMPATPVAARPEATTVPIDPAQTIVGRMGSLMSESQARHGIGFSPFAPPRVIVAVALLPAFHGDDTRHNRGIGFEYTDEMGHAYALAEWPANGGTIARYPLLQSSDDACPDARSFARGTRPSGIVWSTPHGLIMTLQSDGKNDARTLQIEWQKLIRRGGCR